MQWLCFLKRNYPLFNIFMLRICFDLLILYFRNGQILVNCVIFYIFVHALSPRNDNNGTLKNLKKTKISIMHLSMHYRKHAKKIDTFL